MRLITLLTLIVWAPFTGALMIRPLQQATLLNRLRGGTLQPRPQPLRSTPEENHLVPKSIPADRFRTAILLIAGTTIGGGFMALPYRVAPAGFVPAATTLTGVWVFFLAQSMVVVELLINEASERHSVDPNKEAIIGMPSVARAALGTRGEAVVSSLLILLTATTLVSQISKAGSIIAGVCFVGAVTTYRLWCTTVSSRATVCGRM